MNLRSRFPPFLISPPFGNYIAYPGCVRVFGTFTPQRRPGLFGAVASTLRPISGGWVNRIGLRNKGIDAVDFAEPGIYSIAGLSLPGWRYLLSAIPRRPRQILELNLSCPNVDDYDIADTLLREFCERATVTVKLPPDRRAIGLADRAVEAGARYLHLSNTLPTSRGGESGKRLKRINLPLVEEIAQRHPVPIIAGGGIYEPQDVRDYANAGAAHFSLATIWFNPLKAHRLIGAS